MLKRMKTKKPTAKEIKEAYSLIQSLRGKRSAKTGMSMSERGKRSGEARRARKQKAELDKAQDNISI